MCMQFTEEEGEQIKKYLETPDAVSRKWLINHISEITYMENGQQFKFQFIPIRDILDAPSVGILSSDEPL